MELQRVGERTLGDGGQLLYEHVDEARAGDGARRTDGAKGGARGGSASGRGRGAVGDRGRGPGDRCDEGQELRCFASQLRALLGEQDEGESLHVVDAAVAREVTKHTWYSEPLTQQRRHLLQRLLPAGERGRVQVPQSLGQGREGGGQRVQRAVGHDVREQRGSSRLQQPLRTAQLCSEQRQQCSGDAEGAQASIGLRAEECDLVALGLALKAQLLH